MARCIMIQSAGVELVAAFCDFVIVWNGGSSYIASGPSHSRTTFMFMLLNEVKRTVTVEKLVDDEPRQIEG